MDPKNRPLSLQKVKNDSKIKSNSKVRIEGMIENLSCSTIWVDPKTVYELKPTTIIAEIAQKGSKWPQKTKKNQKTEKSYKVKVTIKLSQIQKSELKEL